MNRNLHNMREHYQRGELSEQSVERDPLVQFNKWLKEAERADIQEPNAMALATTGDDGQPSCRMVLLKGVDHGFVFYTNFISRKGHQLTENPRAALTFWWSALERQVRIEGIIETVDEKEASTYFHSRPRGSQVGAASSPQSREIPNREYLEIRYQDVDRRYGKGQIPKPEKWGGYRLIPQRIEFWQGRTNRLHDRIEFLLENPEWRMRRLAP